MSDEVRTEEQRRIAELESLVVGLAREVWVLNAEMDRRNDFIIQARLRLGRLENRLRAADLPTNGEIYD